MSDETANTPAYNSPYKFNGKELDEGTGMYYYGARYYDPRISVWMSVDPLAEKYPNISSYAFCLNNPIVFIDPDGKDIIIYYEVKLADGRIRYKPFAFNGSNHSSAPNNAFVKQFIAAYDYNVKNGGGKNMQEAARNKNLRIPLMEGDETIYKYVTYGSERDGVDKGTVLFNPQQGLMTTDKKILSPSTILEEEFDHAVDDAKQHPAHFVRQGKKDTQYDNKEERRVAEGSVSETAKKNGEVPKNWVKPNHRGTHIIRKNWDYQSDK